MKHIVFIIIILVAGICPVIAATSSTIATVNQSEGDPYDTYYYEYSEILFGTSVDNNGNIEGESTTFSLGSSGKVDLAVFVSNDGEFATNTLYIEIYDDEEEPFDDYSIEIQPEWDWVKFVHTFNKPGTYYFDIYNEEDTFVNSASVTITR
jgi:hypothetical protein